MPFPQSSQQRRCVGNNAYVERKIDARLLAEALLQAPVAWALFDLDGHGVAGSREFAAVFELTPDDLVGLPFEVMIEPGDREGTHDVLARLRSGELDEFVSMQRAPRPGGGDQLVRLTLRALARDGHRLALFSTASPLADAARFDARRIQKLIENIDDTVSLIDENGALIETSGRYKPILGYPAGFWADRTIFDLLHPDDALRVLEIRERIVASPGAVVTDEFRVKAADGTYQPLEVHAVNLLHDPDVSGIVVTSRNIADRKALMRDLAASRDAAIAEAELRTRLIATVSHELRNPLHAMSGMAELLTTLPDLQDEALSMANTLRRQIDGLTTVIDDLLDSSRLGVGVMSLAAHPLTVRWLVNDVVSLAALGARGKPVAVLAHVPDDVPECIQGDETRLRQVLSNLVGNAVKFTSTGEVMLRVAAIHDGLRFEVSDTGRGIAPAELATIFEPFNTGTNAGEGSGAGLGLTIVRQLVELMSGTIVAHSTLGEGSTFTFTVPAQACEPSVELAPSGVSGMSPLAVVGQSVLVVEDNTVNQVLAESQLARLGLRAVVVGTGEAAIEILARGDGPDLVLMDYHLPGIDGLEATRQIRLLETRTRRRAVIIAVTAAAGAADRRACEDAGMDDFLAKPVSLGMLGDTLRKWAHAVPRVTTLSGAVDASVLHELAIDLGAQAVVTELVCTFLNELHGRRAALTEACARDDIVTAKRVAHTLKSGALLLGAMELGRVCQQMESSPSMDEALRASRDILREATDAARWYQTWLSRRPV